MPRKRRRQSDKKFQISNVALYNSSVSHAAFRLYCFISEDSWGREGSRLLNAQLAKKMDCTPEYIRRLLGELTVLKLVEERLIPTGGRLLVPSGVSLSSDERVRRVDEPVDEAIVSGETSVDLPRTPSLGGSPTIVGEKQTTVPTTSSRSSSSSDLLNSLKTTTTTNKQQDISRNVFERYTELFGQLPQGVIYLLTDYLDDPELVEITAACGETPEQWVREAITETALGEPDNPHRYLRRVMSNWIKQGCRIEPDKQQDQPTDLPEFVRRTDEEIATYYD